MAHGGRSSRRGVAVVGGALVVALSVSALLGARSVVGPTMRPGEAAPEATDPSTTSPAMGGEEGAAARSNAAGPLRETVHDRRTRDELRQRILRAWAAEGRVDPVPAAAPPAAAPKEYAPTGPDGRGIDPAYIQSVVRAEVMPMVGKCYEELLARTPKAKGRIELSYTILADEQLGGVVDDVEAKSEGALDDEKLHTCVTESMASVAFKPPKDGGRVTVVYPLELAPDDDEKNEKPEKP